MFLTETHMHTAEGSACASASGREQADQYKSRGYDTIIVTDHFVNGNTAVDRSQPWDVQMDQYCSGYENAKARGDETGLNVLFGIEYSWNAADFLMYGIDKQWLKDNPDMLSISIQELCDRVHEAGGIVIQAHPFREADYIREIKLLPWHCDGVEVYNAGNRDVLFDRRADWYAEQYGFVKTAGSDCHHIMENGRFFGVETEQEIKTIRDYISVIKEKRISGLHVPGRI